MGVTDDIWNSGGAKPVSFREKGDTIEGRIEAIRTKQLPKFGEERLEEWPDGSAKLTPIVTLSTSLRENDEDDGLRDVYLRSNAYTAFGKALREAYKTKPSDSDLIGATLKLQFNAEERSGKGAPRKLFRARITPKQPGADAWDDADKPQGDRTPAGAPARTAKPAPGRPAAMPPGHPAGEDPDDVPF